MTELTTTQNDFICTVDMNDIAAKKKAVNAHMNARSLADYVGVELSICDVMTESGTRNNRNGTYTPCQNTYLIDVDGSAYFTQSDGVARAINAIIALFPDCGKSTADGCIKITCVEQELKSGNTMKTLVMS